MTPAPAAAIVPSPTGDDRLRVLFYPCFYLAEAWNGMDEHMLALARHLKRLGCDLAVVGHRGDGAQTCHLAARAGIPFVELTGGLAEFVGTIWRGRFDLLHVHTPALGGQLPVIGAARLAGARAAVVTVHQVQPKRLPARTRLLNGQLLRLARVVAVSPAVQRSLALNAGLAESEVRVILNGIDELDDLPGRAPLALLAGRRATLRAGCFGRLSPEKGLDVILEAMAELPEGVVELVIVGDGPQRADLEAQAHRLGVASRVRFTGYHSDARRLMREVDVVVHVPRYEGFGLVVLEAMCEGRPVVVNDAPGGMAETVVPGETGLVVAAGSPARLAAALLALAANPAERHRMGAAGRQRFRSRFRASAMAALVASLYGQAHGAGHRRR